ncbi:uncharacterized protein BX664DRAFT_322612 [Halteromyces radiatus]|uniref:uncharacterized protein n=1 Tax=Halteromyces radiatus TaxID=101107 RepID=UPI00221EA0AB|nr:uncharacterized protein BX664DRAFT_322612 [Halteromyces radiatus]KAI8100003.1 hypothetical protein BX664DRAFT_322612 [Halteromyces radiatus]
MPMAKDLANVHDQLVSIAKDSQALARRKHSADDISVLQRRLSVAESEYNSSQNDKNYEAPGQAQVSEEIDRVHHILSSMLQRTD